MRDHGREFVVGIVFFALLVALGWITITLADVRLATAARESFRFTRVDGLAPGAEVWINGVPSGSVTAIDVRPDASVEVTADLRTDLASLDLREDAAVAVRLKSALGGAIVAVETGAAPGRTTVDALRKRTWEARPDPLGAVGDTVASLGPRIEEVLASAKKVLDDVGGRSGRVMENVESFTDDLRALTRDLRDGKGTLGRMLNDDGPYQRLDSALTRVDRVLADVEKGEGMLGRLLRDRAMADDLAETLRDLRSVADRLEKGEGSAGKFLRDGTMYDDLSAAVRDLRGVAADFREGKGLLPRLLRDESLARDAEETLRDVRSIVADVRAGKGTLGKVLADDALYDDLRGALRSIRRGAEEARENAPILTFTGFLFNTF